MRVKLYFEFTRSWSLSCSNIAIFWQITWNYKFGPLTTISEYGKILNFLCFDLDHWQYKNWPCFGMPKKVFSESYTKIERVCVALLGLKAPPHAGQGKIKISVHLSRSPCVILHLTHICLDMMLYVSMYILHLFSSLRNIWVINGCVEYCCYITMDSFIN